MSTLAHLIRCHRLLAGRRTPIPFEELRTRLECSTATLKRVLDQLQDDFGAPLVRARGRGVFYEPGKAATFELPGFWLSATELTALLAFESLLQGTAPSLLTEQLAPIRYKARALLGQDGGLPDWAQRLRLLGATRRDAGPAFATVASALVRRRQLEVRYHARETDTQTTRTLSPQRLTHYRDRWYLDAWCHRREALRSFAVERLLEARERLEAAREVAVVELDAVLATSYGIFSGAPTQQAELLFSAKAARWVAEEQWHPEQQGEWLPDGRWRLRLPYHREEELLMDVLKHAAEVEVIAPAALRAAVRQRLQAALAQYS
jgi:predicted DNA-binding transcriptional regulator YafY